MTGPELRTWHWELQRQGCPYCYKVLMESHGIMSNNSVAHDERHEISQEWLIDNEDKKEEVPKPELMVPGLCMPRQDNKQSHALCPLFYSFSSK